MDTERQPVRDIRDLYALNHCEVAMGFEDGRDGLECPPGASRSFWHGWRCGRVAVGLQPLEPELSDLTQKNRQITAAMRHGVSAIVIPWNGSIQ